MQQLQNYLQRLIIGLRGLTREIFGRKLKILVLGYGANPPHQGHLNTLLNSAKVIKPDLIFLMPYVLRHGGYKGDFPFEHRFKMSEIFAKYLRKILWLKGVEVVASDLEAHLFDLTKGEPNYTIDTVNTLIRMYPSGRVKVYWDIGGDILETELSKWERIEELVTMKDKFQFVYFPRTGYFPKEELIKKYNILAIESRSAYAISGTKIRKAIGGGKSVRDFVRQGFLFPEIAKYIEENKLYEGSHGVFPLKLTKSDIEKGIK